MRNDKSCVDFLQWCLPKLEYRWEGFRKVRRQVCNRINKRIKELNLSDLSEYKNYLEKNKKEWDILDSFCYVTISRFYRDKVVFDRLGNEILPVLTESALKNGKKEIRCLCIGCCSGEEPYTIQIIWNLVLPQKLRRDLPLYIMATDKNDSLLGRAMQGLYSESSFKDLPGDLKERTFDKVKDSYKLKNEFKNNIEFIQQDVRYELPSGDFDLVLCRNLVFTYFSEDLQNQILKNIEEKLKPNGFIIIGSHESLPADTRLFIRYKKENCIYKKAMASYG